MAATGAFSRRLSSRAPSIFPSSFISGSPLSIFRRHLSCSGTQSTDAHEVVGRAGEPHQLRISSDAPQARLAQSTHRFAPAKKLLDAFAHNLAGLIPGRAKRASIRTGRVVSGVDGHMRGDALREQAIDEAARALTLIAANTLGSKPLS